MYRFAMRHPNLVTWIVLAVGMVAVLVWSARDVALSAGQWFWLGLATVLLAGLCAWIISWEADERPEELAAPDSQAGEPPPVEGRSAPGGAGSK